ncbi:hypothetical protein U9M48_038136, partial [Paspalum notatum var. saurae]
PGSVLSALAHPSPASTAAGSNPTWDLRSIGASSPAQPTPRDGRRSGTSARPTLSLTSFAGRPDRRREIRSGLSTLTSWILSGGRGIRGRSAGGDAAAAGRGRGWEEGDKPGLLTRAVDKVFRFVRLAEFEILFVLFFLVAFLLFKDLLVVVKDSAEITEKMSRPQYNQMFVKKPDLDDPWP